MFVLISIVLIAGIIKPNNGFKIELFHQINVAR